MSATKRIEADRLVARAADFAGPVTVAGQPVVTEDRHANLVQAVEANGQAIAAVAQAIAAVARAVDANGRAIKALDAKVDQLGTRMDRLDAKVDGGFAELSEKLGRLLTGL